MRKRTYTLRYDRVTPEGAIESSHSIEGFASLERARSFFAKLRHGQAWPIGYRDAHACIVGPQGEVYATEGPTDEA